MSIHHYNRLLAHADLSQLSPLDKLVAVFISEAINSKKPDLMRLSAAYIAETLDLSLEAVQKATARLTNQGIFTRNSDTRRARSGYVYALAVDCPADCKKAKAHKTALERENTVIGVENAGVIEDKKDSSSNFFTAQNGVTKQDNQDNQDLTENLTFSRVRNSFTYEQFVAVINAIADDFGTALNNDYAIVFENPEAAYENALSIIANSTRPVNSPTNYIGTIFRENPLRLLAEVPGSSTARKPKSANEGKSYLETVLPLAEKLGIDYENEFGNSVRERDLREAHLRGNLTEAYLETVYNSVREPHEWLEHITSPY